MSAAAANGPAIEAIGLVKEFERGRRTVWQRLRREPDKRERFRAADGIDLHVERGEIFGPLGNGSRSVALESRLPLPDAGSSCARNIACG